LTLHRSLDPPDPLTCPWSINSAKHFLRPSIFPIRLPAPIHSPDLPITVQVELLKSCDVAPSADSENCLEVDHMENNKQLNTMWFIITFVLCRLLREGFRLAGEQRQEAEPVRYPGAALSEQLTAPMSFSHSSTE
jgi:hypothetical protein